MVRKTSAAIVALVALGFTAMPTGFLGGAGAAYADSTHGNSHAGGNGNGNGSGNTPASASANVTGQGNSTTPTNHGALASELKGLNAVHANANALEHASPNSQVGRIALYRDAARETIAAQTALDQAKADLAAMPVPARTIDEINADIAALDPNAPDYATALAALKAEQEAVRDYNQAKAAVTAVRHTLTADQAAENAALLVASGGRVLSDAAIAYVRQVLGL